MFSEQVPDSLPHNWLSKSDALPQHSGGLCASSCQVPKHAQGSDIWDQCRSISWYPIKRIQPWFDSKAISVISYQHFGTSVLP